MDATVDTASPPSPATLADGGGRGSAPTTPAGSASGAVDSTRIGSALRGLRSSVWAPVVGRAGAILAGMLALGGVGAVSTLAGAGVVVPLPSTSPTPVELAVGSVWLPPDHERAAATVAPEPLPAAGAAAVTGAAPEPAPSAGVTADGKVILNTATAEQLTKLPRVGLKRAQAILALRQKLGHFRSATELLRVRGIGRKTLRVMLPLFVLDPPSAAPAPDSAKRKEGTVP